MAQYTISTEVAAATTDIDVSKDPFVVYISGNDEQGGYQVYRTKRR